MDAVIPSIRYTVSGYALFFFVSDDHLMCGGTYDEIERFHANNFPQNELIKREEIVMDDNSWNFFHLIADKIDPEVYDFNFLMGIAHRNDSGISATGISATMNYVEKFY